MDSFIFTCSFFSRQCKAFRDTGRLSHHSPQNSWKVSVVLCSWNSLSDGATYVEEDGVKSLYLNGSGAHATTPAVDFSALGKFTIASWVKLHDPPAHPSTIYGFWGPPHFLFDAWANKTLRFQVKNNLGGVQPSLNKGWDIQRFAFFDSFNNK